MDHEQWQKWWTDRAPEYFTDKIWRFSHPDLIDRLNIQPHHCVLELGFGYGRELSQFCALSTNVYGLELTDWSCENTLIELQGRGVRPLPRLKSYDGLRLPFPSGAFNVVYSCFVIQHLSRKHALGLIRETLRVLSRATLNSLKAPPACGNSARPSRKRTSWPDSFKSHTSPPSSAVKA